MQKYEKNILSVRKKFVLLHLENRKGRLAEGLGTGLQNLLLRFKSGSDLKKNRNRMAPVFFGYSRAISGCCTARGAPSCAR